MSLVLLGEGKARYKGEWLDARTMQSSNSNVLNMNDSSN